MRMYYLNALAARFFAVSIATLGLIAPQGALAESAIERGFFQVSVDLAGSVRSVIGTSLSDVGWSPETASQVASASELQLPDSLHFGGLAGALNLVIDKSNGTPLVDGIELAPSETLRFIAKDAGGVGGLFGQISIRLDF